MIEQLAFVGMEKPGQPARSLFFAVLPDGPDAVNIARVAQHQSQVHGLRGRAVSPARLHVSLHYIGDYVTPPESILAAVREAAAAAAALVPSFGVAFDRVMSFRGKPGGQPFVLRGGDGVLGLHELYRHLGAALQKVGVWRNVKLQYEPHVTLLYGGDSVAEQVIDPVGWTVREFVLLHGPHQESYAILRRWRLGA